jgi:lipopolysaccharide export system permease protein
MLILDRQRYWSYLKAYFVCFVALVGLYVVIDLMTNLDEFWKVEEGGRGLLAFIARYYLVRLSLFFDRLCGVIGMLAAIFTVTWMQRNNEHLAMMAAGLSTHRAIRPVIVSAALVSLMALANQEWIIPRVSEELQRTPDDDGKRQLKPFSHRDINGIHIHSAEAFRQDLSLTRFDATFPSERYGTLLVVKGAAAQYIPPEAHRAVLRGGWLIRGGEVTPADTPLDGTVLVRVDSDPWADLLSANTSRVLSRAAVATFAPPRPKIANLPGGTYFLRTNVTFGNMIQSRFWYQFAPTSDLIASMVDSTYQTQRQEITVFLHSRIVRPLTSMVLLLLGLPLVLGGYGRNMFINLGLSLFTSAVFYVVQFVALWLGNNKLLSPELAAWVPLIAFGTLAAARWDKIRT